MDKLKDREHDFASKLKQASIVKRFKEYIVWQRTVQSTNRHCTPPKFAPVSINLDLTSACNFACPHCVDSGIINTGEYLQLADVKETVDVLQAHGLLSVILLGGGEPTLHRDFEAMSAYIKDKGLELGIVTNGSRLDKVINVATFLEKGDWVRISIDAGTEETFIRSHQPKSAITLNEILDMAREVKEHNSAVSLGYSFVIVWEGITVNGTGLCQNIDEMARAVDLAKRHSFDFISFKPCLIRLDDSQKESLLDGVPQEKENKIIDGIMTNLREARRVANGDLKILESVNLRAMLSKKLCEIKRQPKRCHMQFFRTVVSPSGIFHCPAFRGVEKARLADSVGYTKADKFNESLAAVGRSIVTFDAQAECRVVACFYHHVNWWIETFINSNRDVGEIEQIEDDNFFL